MERKGRERGERERRAIAKKREGGRRQGVKGQLLVQCKSNYVPTSYIINNRVYMSPRH